MRFFEDSPERDRLIAQEALVFDVTEALCRALEARGMSRAELADKLGVRPSEVTQRLSGGRNLTLRSIADMFLALDYTVQIQAEPRALQSEAAGMATTGTTRRGSRGHQPSTMGFPPGT